ncbi:DUF2778 domain-containing protein [Mesorhizobium sp. M7D.F.Ca.US.004.01.2.1]|jgi:hypothetical protein|uniref:DUF2778 domain-containing protein n=2 Tax=unclassified Mesorhizobium TaxID=325217 RepID=UPI000FCCA5DB|nr:DUF2778 domain-containing protein [Mesorhizobium sp. M7D.F.Ca.US.004.01.2.1]RUX90888.1 DUF2778 domain-containing protein [Mesorhizobium sp. M7D.F.Ca.US.004.01.2.1]
MALSSKQKIIRDQREGGEFVDAPRSPSFNTGRVVRWIALPCASTAIGLWLIGTMAGLSSVGASLSATSGSLPQTLSMSGSLALVDPLKQHFLKAPFVLANAHGGAQALHDQAVQCGASCFKPAEVSPLAEKSERLVAKAKPVPTVAKSKSQERFERMEASLSPMKLAAVFASAGKPAPAANTPALPVISSVAPQIAEASLVPSVQVMASLSDDMPAPAAERFARLDTGSVVVQTAPQPTGFAQSETPDNSQLALALVESLPVDDEAFASPLPIEESSADVAVSPVETQQDQPGDAASLPDALTDDVPLPTRRPQFDAPQQPKVVQQQSKPVQQPKPARETVQQAQPTKPARQGRPADGGNVLAYAKPDTPSGGLGKAFRNLFNSPGSSSGASNGVAVYDISAGTVYMPDGSRLEAHSGIGPMADQPRYANQKNRGPTPPNTYNLSLRESRFHGVEALRLTPVDGRNKYNRDGLLAHTYLLRGRYAQSSGCVAFKDYARFLAAFKKGKIKRLVVVPRLNGSATRVAADNARGA